MSRKSDNLPRTFNAFTRLCAPNRQSCSIDQPSASGQLLISKSLLLSLYTYVIFLASNRRGTKRGFHQRERRRRKRASSLWNYSRVHALCEREKRKKVFRPRTESARLIPFERNATQRSALNFSTFHSVLNTAVYANVYAKRDKKNHIVNIHDHIETYRRRPSSRG